MHKLPHTSAVLRPFHTQRQPTAMFSWAMVRRGHLLQHHRLVSPLRKNGLTVAHSTTILKKYTLVHQPKLPTDHSLRWGHRRHSSRLQVRRGMSPSAHYSMQTIFVLTRIRFLQQIPMAISFLILMVRVLCDPPVGFKSTAPHLQMRLSPQACPLAPPCSPSKHQLVEHMHTFVRQVSLQRTEGKTLSVWLVRGK